MSSPPFPSSLGFIGLNQNFTHKQFMAAMTLERSVSIRELAYNEWLLLQDDKYEGHPYRWYLSYVQMKTENTRDMT
jgi:hypothetical protein